MIQSDIGERERERERRAEKERNEKECYDIEKDCIKDYMLKSR